MKIEYGLRKSIHEVCGISEMRSVGERRSSRLDLDRSPMDTEDSGGKVLPTGCDNPDLGGKS